MPERRASARPIFYTYALRPDLLAPVLQIIHRSIATFLFKQTGQTRDQAATGAVTLIQRFGSAANLNIHLHALVLDGVYVKLDGADTVSPRTSARPHPPPSHPPSTPPVHPPAPRWKHYWPRSSRASCGC